MQIIYFTFTTNNIYKICMVEISNFLLSKGRPEQIAMYYVCSIRFFVLSAPLIYRPTLEINAGWYNIRINISYSIPQMIFRIVTAITILKTIRGTEWEMWYLIASGISNVALLAVLTVHTSKCDPVIISYIIRVQRKLFISISALIINIIIFKNVIVLTTE